ncbi:phenylacetate-CoA ligase [Catalinimonas alkaloidigena]|uniref:hypothetical protein n=1 Tax=Catalinimonas alkaloidigena TaxID=1075417 RepID=UPI002406AA72|nr:hypothetical protein [Catalinimonas alkaloidigena]MDF9796742.1 phenylacetate-CoA ligase [Catalinimonas alkaloidigena]
MKRLYKQFIRNTLKNNLFFWYRLQRLKRVHSELDLEELLVLQNDKFLKLVKYAYANSSFYRSFYQQHGVDINTIKNISDLNKLPIITKDHIRQNVENILIGIKSFHKTAFTSGTSGTPLKVYRSYSSIIEEEAYIWCHREKFGHKVGMKAVALRADLDRNIFMELDPFSHTKLLSSYRLSEKTAEDYYEEIASYKPNAIYAFPSSVEILANFLLEKNKFLDVPLIFTSSETLYEFQREKIQKVFNARVVDWYGNAERSIALEENKEGIYNELPLYSINEYQDDHILTTGLINFSFPLIRYQVNDVLIPDQNSGKVRQIIGRVDDAIELPDGTKVVRLGLVFKGLNGIDFAQIIQNTRTNIQINVVPSKSYEQKTKFKILDKIKLFIGNEIEIKVSTVTEKEIIKTERGKYKLVINNINSSEQRTASVI